MCGAYGFSVNDAKEVYDRFEVVNTLEDLKAALECQAWANEPGDNQPQPEPDFKNVLGVNPALGKGQVVCI